MKGSDVITYKEKLEKMAFKLRKERLTEREEITFKLQKAAIKRDSNQLFSPSTGTRLHKNKCKLLSIS